MKTSIKTFYLTIENFQYGNTHKIENTLIRRIYLPEDKAHDMVFTMNQKKKDKTSWFRLLTSNALTTAQIVSINS